MKAIVLGGGLIGITTAYFLRQRGWDVMVLDRNPGPGMEASFANGALLTPSMSDPWNSPGSWRMLLASLFQPHSAMCLRAKAIPSLASWGIEFLRNSRPEIFERNALTNLQLALSSLQVMQTLREETSISYGRTARGSLRVFRDSGTLNQAVEVATRRSSRGLTFSQLSVAETIELEPALAPIQSQLTGSIHYHTDETGDAYRFCVALADHARRDGVQFSFDTEVSELQVRSGRVAGAIGPDGRCFTGDLYVVAAGSYSSPLLQRVGVSVPVRPAKGYSVTFNAISREGTLGIPVIDDHLHTALVPLEGALRIAGTAEFTGYDLELTRGRIQNLLTLLKEVLPQAPVDTASAQPWCGLRPMSADGVPIIGKTSVPNLLVNTGHGHLGWTLAAGSARLLADLVTGATPAIDPRPFSLERFSQDVVA